MRARYERARINNAHAARPIIERGLLRLPKSQQTVLAERTNHILVGVVSDPDDVLLVDLKIENVPSITRFVLFSHCHE